MKKLLFLSVLVCFSPALSFAETCSSMPDCESMGYERGYNPACGEDEANYVLCPYDESYRKCIHYTCEGLGFTQEDKTDWCQVIVNCVYDEQYTLCDDPQAIESVGNLCSEGAYESREACEAVYGVGNCAQNGVCYVGDCTGSVVTCGTGVNIVANAIGINPCTPRNADCSTGETVYADWVCRNGYTKVSWGWWGAFCAEGSCESLTYGTEDACKQSCAGTCAHMSSSNPKYTAGRCEYQCVMP